MISDGFLTRFQLLQALCKGAQSRKVFRTHIRHQRVHQLNGAAPAVDVADGRLVRVFSHPLRQRFSVGVVGQTVEPGDRHRAVLVGTIQLIPVDLGSQRTGFLLALRERDIGRSVEFGEVLGVRLLTGGETENEGNTVQRNGTSVVSLDSHWVAVDDDSQRFFRSARNRIALRAQAVD